MPKTAISYENTIIYKLCCKDPTITDIYVGHTTNFTHRKGEHKHSCNNPNSKCYNQYKYQFIREHGGFDNWSMIEIRKVACKDKNEAEREERISIDELKPTLNKTRPVITDEEKIEYNKEYCKGYRQAHKEKCKEYYQANKEKIIEQIKERASEIITCPHCNCELRRGNKSRHEKTKKHQNILNKI